MGERSFKDLPAEVQDYLFGEEVISAYDKVIAAHQLPADADATLAKAVDDVLLGRAELIDLPARLAATFQVDESAAKKMACDVAGHVLTPIASVAGDIPGAVAKWCENPDAFKDIPKIQVKETTPEGVAAKTLNESQTVIKDPILEHRLELILGSYLSGVRTRDAAMDVLMRPTKVGGLAMSEEAARDAIDLVEAKKGTVAAEPVSVVEPAPEPEPEPIPEPAPVPAEEPKTEVKPAPAPITMTQHDEDAADIDTAAWKTQAIVESVPMNSPADATANVVANCGLALDDAQLKKRFETIVDARMSDVRDAYDTRALLESPKEKGGMGLQGKELVRVVETIERVFGDYQRTFATQKRQEKETMLQKKREAVETRERDLQQEERDLARGPGDIPTPSVNLPDPTLLAPEPVNPQTVRQAINASLSPQSIPPSPSLRPRMDDIRFVKRLIGPVEELRTMSLVDFRRLSRDPNEAIVKLKDKVALLEEQGYEKRIAGIKAWRSSPLNKLYLALSQEALLSGKQIGEILAEKQVSKEETLTQAEVSAVMRLNGELRF